MTGTAGAPAPVHAPATVLGTTIEPLQPAPAQALLISDLHVPANGGEPLQLLQFAIDAAVASGSALLVLGDLFDWYVSRVQTRTGIWQEVARRFAQGVAAGVSVTILHGNRDFMLGAEFAAASRARVVAGGVRGALGGADTLLLHGDELCVNDVPYQRSKRWLRHPLTKAVLRRLPLRLALGVADRARSRSKMTIASGDQTRFLPTVGALGAAAATGAQRLVFGHIHRFAHGRQGALEYWVLPAFDATGVGLRAHPDRLEAVRFGAGGTCTPLAAPPPCAWTP